MKNSKLLTIFAAVASLAYLLVNFYLLAHHEPWRDEAQSWLIARDLTPAGLFAQLRFEGHPFLWYFLIMPFAKSGLPYAALGYISLTVMTVTVFLLFRFSPFRWYVNLAAAAGSTFMFYYPVISRNYCLATLMMVVAACLYKDRLTHPVRYGIALALLAQTHIMAAGLASVLALYFAADAMRAKNMRKAAPGIAAAVAGLLILALQLSTSIATNAGISENNDLPRLKYFEIPKAVYNYFKNAASAYTGIDFPLHVFGPIFILALIIWILFMIYRPKQGVMMFAGMGLVCFVTVFIYGDMKLQKVLMLPLIFIFCAWTALREEPDAGAPEAKLKTGRKAVPVVIQALVVTVSLASVSCLAGDIENDLQNPYSGSAQVAAFIKSSVPDGSVIVATCDFGASSIAAYTDSVKFWNPVNSRYFTFVTWDSSRYMSVSSADMSAGMTQEFGGNENLYLLKSYPSFIYDIDSYIADSGLQPIFVYNQKTVCDESYYALYKLSAPGVTIIKQE